MPTPETDLREATAPPADVAVVLVSHDGARWLPGVLEGIGEQAVAPTRVVAVDTGSTDGSDGLLRAALGEAALVRAPATTGYPAAVRLGLEQLPPPEQGGPEWVWLLHDDSRPDPRALEALLVATREHTGADLLGPKLREWPSLRRLLEVGVTASGTGRRETGLERGEYDQGQHDEKSFVLAVNTAGLLVRRRVLDALGGLDDDLPVFGSDLDLGWRAAAAGHATLVVPQAVVFHAEAAHRGLRRTALTGGHPHRAERRAMLFTLLANSRRGALPFQLLRLTLGTVLRALGFLLVRAPGEALDEIAALGSVLGSPRRLRAARARRRAGGADPARARPLLAPWWLPYRHGLDFVGDVAAALTSQAADVAERRRAAQAELDPSSLAATAAPVPRGGLGEDDDEELFRDEGLLARYLTNPVALTLTAVVVLALIAARAAFGSVSGGALSPAPSGAGAWWSLHLDSWHRIGFGTAVPAPGYVLPLALLGSLVGAGAAVSLLLLAAVPVGLWGAFAFLRLGGRLVSPQGAPRWLLVGGATTYAVLPATTGAWEEGRLGLVVATALLPWLAHAAVGFADPEPDRRWRAAWRTGLLLSVVAAFAPVAWLLAALVVVVVLGVGLGVARGAVLRRTVGGPPVLAVLVPVVLLSPWWVAAVAHHAAAALVLDTGRLPTASVGPLDALTGRLGDLAATPAIGAAVLVLAVLALLPRATRVPVLLCWVVAVLSLGLAALLGLVEVHLAAVSTPAGLGVPVVVAQAAWISAAVLGAQGATRSRPAGVRRWLGLAVAALAALVPLAGLVSFLVDDDSLDSAAPTTVPAYMVQNAETGPQHGVLVVRGDVADGLTYVVRRGEGVTLGQDEPLALTPAAPDVAATMGTLLSRPTGAEADELGRLGVDYVYVPAPVDGSVAAALDSTPGLAQASSDPGTRAWQVTRPVDPDAADGPGSWWRVVLLLVEAAGIVLTVVLCLPTVRARRGEPDPTSVVEETR